MKFVQRTILIFVLFMLIGINANFSYMAGGQDQEDFPNIYIDASVGDGGVGSQADPYNDFSDINWTTGEDNSIFDYLNNSPSQGVQILGKCGETWREQITIGCDGLADYRIRLGSYGSGTKPKIFGSDQPTGWKPVPPVTANLALWLDGDYSTITTTGSGVSQWNDISGNSNHAVQTTDANRPLQSTVGTHTSVYFDSSTPEYLVLDPGIASDPCTIFAVVQITDTATVRRITHAGTSSCLEFRLESTEKSRMVDAGEVNIATSNSAVTTGSIQVIGCSWDGTNYVFWNGASTDGSGANARETENPITRISSHVETTGFEGHILCFLIYSAELSEANGTAVASYLVARYAETGIAWTCDDTFTEDVGNIIFNNDELCGVKCQNESDLDTQGEFWYDSTNDLVKLYSTTDPDTFYTDIEIAHRSRNIDCVQHNYITIDGLECKYCGNYALNFTGSSNIIVENCDISYSGGWYGGAPPLRQGNAITFWNYTGQTSTNNVVRYNTFDNIYDLALCIEGQGGADTIWSSIYFYCNIIKNTEQSMGLLVNEDAIADDIRYENNTCITAGSGFGARPLPKRGGHFILFPSTGTITNIYVRNNIFYEGTKSCLNIADGTSQENLDEVTIDNNCYYQASGDMINYQETIYTMAQFATYQSEKGKDANSIATDPLMTDPANGDFTLQSGSPCIDAGTDVGLTTDYDGNTIPRNGTLNTNGLFRYVSGALYMFIGSIAEGIEDIGAYEYISTYKFKDGHLYLRLSDRFYLRIN